MEIVSEIRSKIADWIQGNLSLEEFEDWFSVHTWNVYQWGSEDAVALVYQVELRLSEHSCGHLPTSQMVAEFRRFVQDYRARLEVSEPQEAQVISGTSFTVSPVEVRFGSGLLAGRRLS
jgi:hypothetical protein